jgi:hypothetical protein
MPQGSSRATLAKWDSIPGEVHNRTYDLTRPEAIDLNIRILCNNHHNHFSGQCCSTIENQALNFSVSPMLLVNRRVYNEAVNYHRRRICLILHQDQIFRPILTQMSLRQRNLVLTVQITTPLPANAQSNLGVAMTHGHCVGFALEQFSRTIEETVVLTDPVARTCTVKIGVADAPHTASHTPRKHTPEENGLASASWRLDGGVSQGVILYSHRWYERIETSRAACSIGTII